MPLVSLELTYFVPFSKLFKIVADLYQNMYMKVSHSNLELACINQLATRLKVSDLVT